MNLDTPDAGVRAMLEAMEEADLAIQQIATEGAVAAMTWLLQRQCHPLLAVALFEQLRGQLAMAREIAQEKGFTVVEFKAPDVRGLH
jgi:hypothetical protein